MKNTEDTPEDYKLAGPLNKLNVYKTMQSILEKNKLKLSDVQTIKVCDALFEAIGTYPEALRTEFINNYIFKLKQRSSGE